MLQILPPHPALRPFVKAYWYLHIQHNMPLVSLPIAPVPETGLYFYLKGKLCVNYLDNSTIKMPDNLIAGQKFERKFVERIGVSPKFYGRVIRFNLAMKLKQKASQLSWMNVAHDCGYFDHNHLLRDFKQFTGAVPSGFDFENAVIY